MLIRSPYGRAGVAGAIFAAPLARRGFQVFIQSTRGTFGSGGEFRPFLHEKSDGLATVAWLREQPWCDGRVATTGGSYLGHTQWAIAPYVDPPLAAVSLNVTAAKITAAFYEHGAPGLRNALNWSGIIGTQERGRLPNLVPNPMLVARLKRGLGKLPLQSADVDVTGAPVTFWRDFLGHAEPGDDFWAGVDHDEADLTRLPPVSMVTGWWDLFLPQQLRDYTAIRAAGVPARLVVGPWLHAEPGEIKAISQEDTGGWATTSMAVRHRPACRCACTCSRPRSGSISPTGRRRSTSRSATTCGRKAASARARGGRPEARLVHL